MQIIFEEKRKVQPYYIIDLSRSSWEIEIKTMNDIKSLLVSDYPKKSELMEPVMIFNKNDISIDEEVSEAWKSIRNKRHIGNQYIWLASFIKKTGIKNMEMSIVNSDDCESNSPSLIAYLQDERITSAEKAIFKYFSLPVKNLTKSDMYEITKSRNWLEILKNTWFCHHPLPHPFKMGVPCGVCNPCRVAVEEGFGHKIPVLNRVAGKWVKAVWNSNLLKKLR
jgi:hypothetical protein